VAKGIPARLSPAEGRKFGLTVGTAFLVIAALMVWRGHPAVASGAGIVAALLVLAGLVIPGKLGPVYRAWMRLALAISRVTTPLIMGLVYFTVFTPIGLLRRLRGNALVRKPGPDGYWITRPAGARRGNLSRQF
jgi:hypothetical protein